MLRKFFATGSFLCVTLLSFAQQNSSLEKVTPPTDSTAAVADEPEKKPALTISGSADTYFKYDFAKQGSNNRTSFTNANNTFALGMASVKFEHAGDKVSAVADLGFGPRAMEFAYNDAGIFAAVKQLYVSYAPIENLKFTAGTWATHIGYELVDPQLNRNYSMSYMFTNGPFTHAGLKADLTVGKSGFMVGIANPTDYRLLPAGKIEKKFFIAQYSLAATDGIKLYANFVGGKNPDTSVVNQFDLVGTFAVSKKFNIGVNATLNRSKAWDGSKNEDAKSWWGAAAYLNLDPTDVFGLTLRSELFDDKDGVKGFGTSIFANTLSANFRIGGFTFIPELRIESAGGNIYSDKDGAGTKSAASFLLAAVYKF